MEVHILAWTLKCCESWTELLTFSEYLMCKTYSLSAFSGSETGLGTGLVAEGMVMWSLLLWGASCGGLVTGLEDWVGSP